MARVAERRTPVRPDLETGLGKAGGIGFWAAVLAAILFVAYSVYTEAAGVHARDVLPFTMLFIALPIALSFELVNGFHDTANAVATVIYTNSMPRMVSSLLIAAIIWNLDLVSRHPVVEFAHSDRVDHRRRRCQCHAAPPRRPIRRGMGQAQNIGCALLLSPLIGFFAAALPFIIARVTIRHKDLHSEAEDGLPPPWWIRVLLIVTCTHVSFAHRSNDGQKGMGLIMLILIGTVPTAYALNRAVPAHDEAQFHTNSIDAQKMLTTHAAGVVAAVDPRAAVTVFVADKKTNQDTISSLCALVGDIDRQVTSYGRIAHVPGTRSKNMRNDTYLASGAIKRMTANKSAGFADANAKTLKTYKDSLDKATRFIPTWVKIAVALTLGLGAMTGWKRIVVTVGEKIGRSHLTLRAGRVGRAGWQWRQSGSPTRSACRCRRPTSCPRALRGRWRPIAPGSRRRRSAIWCPRGC